MPIIVRVPLGACTAAPAAGGSSGVGAIPTRVCLPPIGFVGGCALGAAAGGSIGKVIPSGWVCARLASGWGSGPPHAAQLRLEGAFSVPQRVQAGMS
jgi:hypothetical protein